MAKKGTALPDKVQQQRQTKEQLAAAKAAKALTPKDHEAPEATAPAEPTLAERLAAIDRRAKERAEDEKRQLAAQYLNEARGELKRLVKESGNEELVRSFNEVAELERLTASNGTATSRAAEDESGETGTRMKRAEKEKYEAQIVAFLVGKSDGVRLSDVVAHTGLKKPQAANLLKGLVEAHKIGRDGERASTVYLPK